MEVLYPRCAGLDVHKDLVVACVRLAEGAKVELATYDGGHVVAELADADPVHRSTVAHVYTHGVDEGARPS